MSNEKLVANYVQLANARKDVLYKDAGSPPLHQQGLLPEAFDELQTTLEELEVAGEELRQQNETLIEAQHLLVEERNRYSQLFNIAPDASLVTDLSGIVREVNTAAANLFNIAQQYMRGKPIANYIDLHDREQFRTQISRMLDETGSKSAFFEVAPRSAEPLPCEVFSSKMYAADGNPVAIRWTFRLLGKSADAQPVPSANEISANAVWQLLDELSEPFYVLDALFQIILVNRKCLDAWKRNRASVLGKTLWEIFPSLQGTAIERELRACAQTREPGHFDTQAFGGGRWLEIDILPTQSGLAICWRDITENKELRDEELRVSDSNRRIAAVLQRSMMSSSDAADYPSLEVETLYEPAWDDALVGGDFYDVFSVDNDGPVALVVGDVTGKGLAAARYTAQVKYALRAFYWQTRSASGALSLLNDYIFSMQRDMAEPYARLVAMTFAVIDPKERSLTVVTAGGLPALILRNGNEIESFCDSPGMLIGVEAKQSYTDAVCHLSDDSIVILTTDGITDARSPEGDFLDMNGLLRMVQSLEQQFNLTELGCEILDRTKRFAGGVLSDDVCVLMVRLSKNS